MFRDTSLSAAEAFVAAFGSQPEGVWSVPGRVSLMGDHTDREDGLTFGFTHPARSAAAVSRRDDRMVHVISDLSDERVEIPLDQIEPPVEHAWYDYPLGTIWAAIDHIQANTDDDDEDEPRPTLTGLNIAVTTDLPIGGGLASSASICAAVALAINELWGLELPRVSIVRLGFAVENSYVGASTGMSDHVTVLNGESDKVVFYDSRGSDTSLIDAPDLEQAGLVQLLIETGETHRNWERVIADRHASCDRVGQALGYRYLREAHMDEFEAATGLDEVDRRRGKYVMTEIQRVLDLVRVLRTEGPAATAHLFNESQRSLREDFEATTERIDVTVDVALSSGALAARMTGSGFGGSVFVLVPTNHETQLRENISAAYAEYGWPEPKVYPLTSSDGARRDL